MEEAEAKFTVAEERFLRQARVGRIATIDHEDGAPHCVAVDYIFHEGRFYFGSDRRKRKVKNLLADNRVAFEVDTYRELPDGSLDWRGIMAKGRASLVEDPDQKAEVVRLTLEKYPTDTHDMETNIVVIRPHAKFPWGPWDRFRESR